MHRIRYCTEFTSSLLLKHLLNLLLLCADVTSLSRTLSSAVSIYLSANCRGEVGVKWETGSLLANCEDAVLHAGKASQAVKLLGIRNSYKIFVENYENKRPTVRPRYR
jgi:hypothetical protein